MKVVIVGAGVAGPGHRLAAAASRSRGRCLGTQPAGPGRDLGRRRDDRGRRRDGIGADTRVRIRPLFQFAMARLCHGAGSRIGTRISYRRDGALIVARTAAEAAAFESWNGVVRLSAAETLDKEPMLAGDISGALWAPDEAQVDSRALGLALAEALVRGGGELARNEPAVRVVVHNGRAIAVATPFGHVEADAVILAAGAWSAGIGGLPDAVLPPVRPVKGEMIAVTPPPGAALPRQVVWGNDVYLVPRGGRLLIGATTAEAGFDTSVTDTAAAWLSSRAIALMPPLATWEIAEHWAGLRPASPDGLPILGRTALDGLYAATGPVPQRYPVCTGHSREHVPSRSGTRGRDSGPSTRAASRRARGQARGLRESVGGVSILRGRTPFAGIGRRRRDPGRGHPDARAALFAGDRRSVRDLARNRLADAGRRPARRRLGRTGHRGRRCDRRHADQPASHPWPRCPDPADAERAQGRAARRRRAARGRDSAGAGSDGRRDKPPRRRLPARRLRRLRHRRGGVRLAPLVRTFGRLRRGREAFRR